MNGHDRPDNAAERPMKGHHHPDNAAEGAMNGHDRPDNAAEGAMNGHDRPVNYFGQVSSKIGMFFAQQALPGKHRQTSSPVKAHLHPNFSIPKISFLL
jgi:hypothetical protein